MKTTKILHNIKPNDLVFIEVSGNIFNPTPIRQIIRIKTIDYHDDGEWFDYTGRVVYTNTRLHKSDIDNPLTNCLGISQIISEKFVEVFAKSMYMWKSNEFLMSDEEKQKQISDIRDKIRY